MLEFSFWRFFARRKNVWKYMGCYHLAHPCMSLICLARVSYQFNSAVSSSNEALIFSLFTCFSRFSIKKTPTKLRVNKFERKQSCENVCCRVIEKWDCLMSQQEETSEIKQFAANDCRLPQNFTLANIFKRVFEAKTHRIAETDFHVPTF